MLKKVVKMFVAALIVIGVKNSNVGAVEPIPRPTSVGTCRSLFELGIPQSTVGKSNLQIFKVLLNGGSIWKDIFLGFWSYSCDNVIRADKVSDREIFWDKDGNFNIYSLAYMDSGEVKRQHGVVGLLFYDKSSWKHDSGFSMKYDIIAVRLPDNINIDLMAALPHQTRRSFEHTLRAAAALRPEHISVYSLIIEEGNPFARMYREGEPPLPDEETEREMDALTERILSEAGYHRYEISNYARDGR